MDWKSALVTFAIIFFAELGDKTQLMIMSMSSRAKSPLMIFFGAVTALVASSLIAVMAGDSFLRLVPIRVVRIGTGLAFIGIGTLLILRSR